MHFTIRTLRRSTSSFVNQLHTNSTNRKKLKVLFFGTDTFAVSTLKSLHREHTLDNGCVQSLESCCSKMKDLVPPVKRYCQQHKIPHHNWPPDTTLCQKFDIGVVSSFGHMIPTNIIEAFPLGVFNVHGSTLPKYRGAAPIIHALLNGDCKTGVTIMEVKPEKFDVGDILATKEIDILPEDDRPSLTKKVGEIGADLLTDVLRDLDWYLTHKECQDKTRISYGKSNIHLSVLIFFLFFHFDSSKSKFQAIRNSMENKLVCGDTKSVKSLV